jgi:hypothetical protein
MIACLCSRLIWRLAKWLSSLLREASPQGSRPRRQPRQYQSFFSQGPILSNSGWSKGGSAAREPNGGLIVLPVPTTVIHRNLIIKLAAQHQLPAVYNSRYWIAEGGLVSYGPDVLDQYRSTAGYVDRILRGTKPADLPVQAPTKYELVINLKTAKALGLTVPDSLLARADEVIE